MSICRRGCGGGSGPQRAARAVGRFDWHPSPGPEEAPAPKGQDHVHAGCPDAHSDSDANQAGARLVERHGVGVYHNAVGRPGHRGSTPCPRRRPKGPARVHATTDPRGHHRPGQTCSMTSPGRTCSTTSVWAGRAVCTPSRVRVAWKPAPGSPPSRPAPTRFDRGVRSMSRPASRPGTFGTWTGCPAACPGLRCRAGSRILRPRRTT